MLFDAVDEFVRVFFLCLMVQLLEVCVLLCVPCMFNFIMGLNPLSLHVQKCIYCGTFEGEKNPNKKMLDVSYYLSHVC